MDEPAVPSKTDSNAEAIGPTWIFQPPSTCRQPRSGISSAHPSQGVPMRFYKQPHAFYAGVDLHARNMFTHILDHGEVSGTLILKSPWREGSRRRAGNTRWPDPE